MPAQVCLCIVTHDVDLATLINDEEPLSASGDAASGCKLFTRCETTANFILFSATLNFKSCQMTFLMQGVVPAHAWYLEGCQDTPEASFPSASP